MCRLLLFLAHSTSCIIYLWYLFYLLWLANQDLSISGPFVHGDSSLGGRHSFVISAGVVLSSVLVLAHNVGVRSVPLSSLRRPLFPAPARSSCPPFPLFHSTSAAAHPPRYYLGPRPPGHCSRRQACAAWHLELRVHVTYRREYRVIPITFRNKD